MSENNNFYATMLQRQVLLAPAKKIFDETFPDHSKRLHMATTDSERIAIMLELKQFAADQYEKQTGLALDDPSGGGTYFLLPSEYTNLTTLTGDSLINEMTSMVNTLSFVKGMTDEVQISGQMFNAGCYLMVAAGFTAMFASAAIVIGSSAGIITAGVAGIAAAGGAGPVVALVVAIVVAVLVPFLYFMLKPAYILSFVINDTTKVLSWKDHYEVHGKLTGWASSIPARVPIQLDNGRGTNVYNSMGIITGTKNNMALIGCQLGFRYSFPTQTKPIHVAIGTESPLTSIYVDNNVWTEFNVTANQVATDTNSNNKLSSTATLSPLTSTINCAKASGDGAYSVAVISDQPNQ